MVTSRMKITQKLASFVFPSPRSNRKPSAAHRTGLSPNQANHNRCQFTFSGGRQCRMQSAQLCAHHGSKQQSSSAESPELQALCLDLTTATNINRALSHVFLLMAQGRITQKQAVAFGYLSQLLLQTVPGIRGEFVSVHGYRAWEQRLKSSLEPNQNRDPDSPSPNHEGGKRQEAGREGNEQPSTGVVEPKKAVGITAFFRPEQVELEKGEYYADIYRRSLDLLDRKFDTTPEGRGEANALLLELELMNPKPEKPRRDFLGQTADLVRRLRDNQPKPAAATNTSRTQSVRAPARQENAVAEPPDAPMPPTPIEPGFCSSGRPAEARQAGLSEVVEREKAVAITALFAHEKGGRPEAFSASAPSPSPAAGKADHADNFVAPPSRRPQSQCSPPPQNLQSPAPASRTAHSTDWYAPASWSGRPQPNPFPSRQEQLKRKLRDMSDRRRQHQNQCRAFWR